MAQGIIPRITVRGVIGSAISLGILIFVINLLPPNIRNFFKVG